MTEEELKALVEDLKVQVDATNAKNKELLGKLRESNLKNKEIDLDTYTRALEENDTLKSELSKTKGELNLKAKDLEKLSGTLTEKENYLKNLTLENSLNEQLTKANVKPELLPAVKALLKGQASVNENNVLIGDKAINDFMTEWSATDGKAYIQAPANSGTGATGSNGGGNVQKLSDLSESERINLFKTDPIRFNQMKQGL